MSDDLTLAFGRGRYRFRLPMARILEIERLCGDKSISTMYEEMSIGVGLDRDTMDPRYVGAGPVRLKDVYEIIRCAAIGGGEAEIAGERVAVSTIDATRLVDENVADGRPGLYAESVPVAWAILHHTLLGARLKKKEPDEKSPSPTDEVA